MPSRKERRVAHKRSLHNREVAFKAARSMTGGRDVMHQVSDEMQATLSAVENTLLNAVGMFHRELDMSFENTVLLVARSDAPMADRIVPEELRGEGQVVTRLVKREALADVFVNYVDIHMALKLMPSCGHLQVFVATKTGCLLKCTECDLGIKRRAIGDA